MMTILTPILILLGLSLVFGALLGFAAIHFRVDEDPLVDQIDNIMPQTQCGQCGYPGCRPYAEAIAQGEAINKCPPGGSATVQALADMLGRDFEPLDTDKLADDSKQLAFIREEECIGCTLCIQACPVDAILGAAKYMHTVLETECTGCRLCVEPCPRDCIDMVPVKPTPKDWHWPMPKAKLIAPPVSIIVSDHTHTGHA